MIERIKGVSVFKQREYLKAENEAHDKLREAGYLPQGCDMKFNKVVVFKIENENSNNEKKEIYHFNNWQEAVEKLL